MGEAGREEGREPGRLPALLPDTLLPLNGLVALGDDARMGSGLSRAANAWAWSSLPVPLWRLLPILERRLPLFGMASTGIGESSRGDCSIF